jgi:hypothetical protein
MKVSPDTHILIFKVFTAFGDKIDEENLLDYISPVLVKNSEQAKILRETYDELRRREVPLFPPVITPVIPERPVKLRRFRLWLWMTMPLTILLLAILYFFLHPRVREFSASVIVSEDANVGRPILFNAAPAITDPADTLFLRFIWRFGDGETDSGSYVVAHSYDKPGNYTASLELRALSPEAKVIRPDTVLLVSVCLPAIKVLSDAPAEITIGTAVRFTLQQDSFYSIPVRYNWFINDSALSQHGDSLSITFTTAGDKIIRCKTMDTAAKYCSAEAAMPFSVKDPSQRQISILQDGDAIREPSSSPRRVWVGLLFFLTLAPLVTIVVLRGRLAKKKRISKKKAGVILSRFVGRAAPFEIPFRNYDELIEDEGELLAVARNYKRRSTDSTLRLNIPGTIASTIRSEGMMSPVWSSGTRSVEYLILIDRNNSKSQQVSLFEYLLKKFAHNDLYFEKFYFNTDPDICTNTLYPNGIHLSRLFDLYPNHVLLLFGTGEQLISRGYPAINKDLLGLFRKWSLWAICTPTGFCDWGLREQLLQEVTALLPADPEGQLLLFRLLENNGLKHELKGTGSYKTTDVDFDDPDQLEKYLADPFLFQWICAVMVYPRMEWNVLISIGDRIQKKYYEKAAVNYRALLRLTRIKWMAEGSVPDSTRLGLLKRLEPRNEIIARETMIRILEEAARRMKESSFAWEELQTQLLINKFLLYSSDPGNEKYSSYANAHNELRTLWEQGRIFDYPLLAYLGKGDKKDNWSTVIGNKQNGDRPGDGVAIDKYLKDSIPVVRKKIYRATWALLSLSLLMAALLIVLSFATSRMAGSRADAWLALTTRNDDIAITARMDLSQCLDPAGMKTSSTRFLLRLPGNQQRQLDAQDTVLSLKIPYRWIRDSLVRLSVRSADTSQNLDTVFSVQNQRLSLGIRGCVVRDTGSCNWVSSAIDSALLEGLWLKYPIDSTGQVSFSALSIYGGTVGLSKIIRSYSCPSASGHYKLLLSSGGTIAVARINLTNARDRMEWGVDPRRYTNPDSAAGANSTITMSARLKIGYRRGVTMVIDSTHLFSGDWYGVSGRDSLVIYSGSFTVDWQQKQWSIIRVISVKDPIGAPIYRLARGGTSKRPFLIILSADKIQIIDDDSYLTEQIAGSPSLYSWTNTYTRVREGPKQTEPAQIAQGQLVSVPRQLGEIWQGGTSNRAFRITSEDSIYYAVGNWNKVDVFHIENVYQKNNIYKVIAKGTGGYKVFFAANVTASSFDLSVCQGMTPSKEQLSVMDSGYCDKFNTMHLWYRHTLPRQIYLPADASSFTAEQRDSMNILLRSPDEVDSLIVYVNTALRGEHITDRNFQIRKSSPLNQIKNAKWVFIPLNENLFQRDYILVTKVKKTAAAPSSLNVAPSGEPAPGERRFTMTLIKNYPSNYTLFRKIALQLKSDSTSKVRLEMSYSTADERKQAEGDIATMKNLFYTLGVTQRYGQVEQKITEVGVTSSAGKAPGRWDEVVTLVCIGFPERFGDDGVKK